MSGTQSTQGSPYALANPQDAGRALVALADDLPRIFEVARCFGASGMFDCQNPEQAFVKLLMGAELGLSPAQAMREIHVIEGKPSLGVHCYSRRIRQHPRYDYWPLESSFTVCEVAFYDTHGRPRTMDSHGRPAIGTRAWTLLGTTRITIEQARELGWTQGKHGTKKNWQQHPDAMLFARCLSRGARLYCPDAMAGVYVHGEIPSAEEEEPPPIKDITPTGPVRDSYPTSGCGRGAHEWVDGSEEGVHVCAREGCDAERDLRDPHADDIAAAYEEAIASGELERAPGDPGPEPIAESVKEARDNVTRSGCRHPAWVPAALGGWLRCSECGHEEPEDEPDFDGEPESEDGDE